MFATAAVGPTCSGLFAGRFVGGVDGTGRNCGDLWVESSTGAMEWDGAGRMVGGVDGAGCNQAGLRVESSKMLTKRDGFAG